MRCVVQRVKRARVSVDGVEIGAIGVGICALVGVGKGDTLADAASMAEKIVNLRIFEDEAQKMNRAVSDVDGAVLLVSQFTLFGDTRRGRRPSFTMAMEPDAAAVLFGCLCDEVRRRGVTVATGRFRADMQVELVNDGPVTLLIDTTKSF